MNTILKVGEIFQTLRESPVQIIGLTRGGLFLGEDLDGTIVKYFEDGTPVLDEEHVNIYVVPKPKTYRYFNIYENHDAFGGNQYSGYDDQSEAERFYRNRPSTYFKRVAMVKMDLETFEVSNVTIK